MVKYDCAPPVLASRVWEVLPDHLRQTLAKHDYVAPGYMRLAMGGTHSVHILMTINLYTCSKILIKSGKTAREAAGVSVNNFCHGDKADKHQYDLEASSDI